jgi:hypothetical protein
MANIQQAAQWLDEGKAVRRSGYLCTHIFINEHGTVWCRYLGHAHVTSNVREDRTFVITTEDLLADDWEIAA